MSYCDSLLSITKEKIRTFTSSIKIDEYGNHAGTEVIVEGNKGQDRRSRSTSTYITGK